MSAGPGRGFSRIPETYVGPGWVQLFANIWNALPVLSTAAAFLGAPFLLLFFLLFAGTPFGRSIGGDGDMLLGLFNDVYEDYRLDQPWLLAKVLSQMFPSLFPSPPPLCHP